jgi:hypothetical protein
VSYPQPNFDQYALNGYKFARLNTPLISDGDIYESQQGAQGFAIGPDSDISKVNVAYFDDQVPRFLNQVAITPERAFPGFFAARNEVNYVPSNRPGRILIWSDEFYNNTWQPFPGIDTGGRIDFEVPVLDVIQYFAPAAQSMNQGRNDKEYWYDFLNPPFAAASVSGTGDSFAFGPGPAPQMTLTDSAGLFTPGVVGLSILFTGALSAGNNVFKTITGYISPTQITYNNAGGVAEADPTVTWQIAGTGPVSWTVVIPWYGRRFADLIFQNNQTTNVEVSITGLHYKPGTQDTAATQTPLIDDGLLHGGTKFVTVGPGGQINAVVLSSGLSDGGSVSVSGGNQAVPIFQVNAGIYDALAFRFNGPAPFPPLDPRIQCTVRVRTSDRENG